MNTATHHLTQNGLRHPVTAVEPVPGLRVYETPAHLHTARLPQTWMLGHHSGRALAAFDTEAEAIVAAYVIEDFTDWTRTAEELLADPMVDPQELFERLWSETDGVVIAQRVVEQPAA